MFIQFSLDKQVVHMAVGKPFEKLAQAVFQSILRQDAVENVKVDQDVILQGKATKHQIDVYWQFKVGQITYETIVQAKDWKSSVKKEQMATFHDVIEDLPGNPKGIMVTRKGFQKGALEIARHHGIICYILSKPSDADWKGRVRIVEVNLNFYIPSFSDIVFVPDNEWAAKERERLHLDQTKISFSIRGRSDQLNLLNEDGSVRTSIAELLKSMLPSGFAEEQNLPLEASFTEPTFMETDSDLFKVIKLKGISAKLTMSRMDQKLTIRADEFISHVLKNVLSGDINFIDSRTLDV